MNAKNALVVALPALLCGAALGWLLHPAPAATVPEKKTEPSHRIAKPSKTDDAAALSRLRARIADLEEQLAAAQQTTNAVGATAEQTPPPRGERRGPPSAAEMRAHMEEIRKNDPALYAQRTNSFAQWRARRQERTQNQMDLLASVDTTHMTKAQRKTHDRYQELILRQAELRELLNPQDESVTDEQREALFKEMHQIREQVNRLARDERDTLLTQTANALGYTGDDASEIVDSIKAVYQATETHGGRGPGGRGPGGMPPPPSAGR